MSEQLPLFDMSVAEMAASPLPFLPAGHDYMGMGMGMDSIQLSLLDSSLRPAPGLLPEEPVHSRRWQDLSKRVILSTIGAAVGGGLFGIGYGWTHAEVKDDEGLLPATISAQYGSTTVDTGIGGKGDIEDLTKFGFGLNIKLDKPPAFLSNPANVSLKDLQQNAKQYVGQYGDLGTTKSSYKTALEKSEREKERVAGPLSGSLLLITNLAISSLAAGGPERRRRALAGAVLPTIAAMGTEGLLAYSWVSDHQVSINQKDRYALSILDGTPFEGMVVDNLPLAAVINQAKPIFEQEKARQDARNEAFLAEAYRSIDKAIETDTFVPPKNGEQTVLVLSDLHSNADMIKVYTYLVDKINEKYGDDTITLVVFTGDQTYGSTSELGLVKAESRIAKNTVKLDGNHDDKPIGDYEEELGEIPLEGKTVTTPEGLEVLGADDPDLTPVSSLFDGGGDVSRHKDGKTEEEVGDELLAEAEKTNPALMLNHEAYTQKNPLLLERVSQESIDEFFKTCRQRDRQGLLTPIKLPAGLTGWGHWHRKFQSCTLRYADGRWTVVAEFDTAGGVPNGDTGGLSFPFTTPAKQASGVFITIDVESELTTRLQEFNTETNGFAHFRPDEFIGTPPPQDDSTLAFKVNHQGGTHTSVTVQLPRTQQEINEALKPTLAETYVQRHREPEDTLPQPPLRAAQPASSH